MLAAFELLQAIFGCFLKDCRGRIAAAQDDLERSAEYFQGVHELVFQIQFGQIRFGFNGRLHPSLSQPNQ